MAHDPVTMTPIGHVVADRTAAVDDAWDAVTTRIELDRARFGPDALCGLEAFSHVEIVFLFDRVPEQKIETGARHPRGNTDWPRVGIFAQRAKNRANRIGVTMCRCLGVRATTLHLSGLDAIDGTPVLDIKPVMSGFLPRGTFFEPAWSQAVMQRYWSSDTKAQ